MNDTLKVAGRIGAELGAAKAENEKLRQALKRIIDRCEAFVDDEAEMRTPSVEVLMGIAEDAIYTVHLADAALSKQAEPTDTFTAVEMATAAAQGFRDGQAAVEQAVAQDEREAPEVVAIPCCSKDGDWYIDALHPSRLGEHGYLSEGDELMTVAQHERIVAALSARPAQRERIDPFSVAEAIRKALDRNSCPNVFLVIAYEAAMEALSHQAEPVEPASIQADTVNWKAVANDQKSIIEQLQAKLIMRRGWLGLGVDEREAFEAEFPRIAFAPAAYWSEERQQYVGHGDAFENNGSAYQRRFEQWKLERATRPAQTEQQPAYVECRECTDCGHVGINDAHPTDATCAMCDWSGPSPVEDQCPDCGKENAMGAACPKCSGRYRILAETHVAAPIAQTAPQPEQSGLVEALGAFVSLAEDRLHELGAISPEMAECLANGRAALSAQGESHE